MVTGTSKKSINNPGFVALPLTVMYNVNKRVLSLSMRPISLLIWCQIDQMNVASFRKPDPRITIWHHEACRVMTTVDREERSFSITSSHSFLLSIKFRFLFKKTQISFLLR